MNFKNILAQTWSRTYSKINLTIWTPFYLVSINLDMLNDHFVRHTPHLKPKVNLLQQDIRIPLAKLRQCYRHLSKFAQSFCLCLCFGRFFMHCYKLFVKFNDGMTTGITSWIFYVQIYLSQCINQISQIRNIAGEDGKLNMPRFSVCLDPPTSFARLSKLGLAPDSWNINQLRNDFVGPITWPISSENKSDLFERPIVFIRRSVWNCGLFWERDN